MKDDTMVTLLYINVVEAALIYEYIHSKSNIVKCIIRPLLEVILVIWSCHILVGSL